MMAGIDFASGDIIVGLDGDLQNDLADIQKLVANLVEDYNVVSGWWVNRKDAALRRNLPSGMENWLISTISGIHRPPDHGCSLKAYRKDVVKGVKLYGEIHRSIPIYASWQNVGTTMASSQGTGGILRRLDAATSCGVARSTFGRIGVSEARVITNFALLHCVGKPAR